MTIEYHFGSSPGPVMAWESDEGPANRLPLEGTIATAGSRGRHWQDAPWEDRPLDERLAHGWDNVRSAMAKWGDEYARRGNAILEMVINPCPVPWTVYARLARPILGDIALALITPSPQEIVEEIVAPTKLGGCRRRHKPGKGKSIRQLYHESKHLPKALDNDIWQQRKGFVNSALAHPSRLLPDVDELVATRLIGKLPVSDAISWAGARAEVNFFWRIWDRADAISFSVMLIDLATEGFANWHSGLIQTEECAAAWAQWAEITNANSTVWQVDGEAYIPMAGTARADNGARAFLSGITLSAPLWRFIVRLPVYGATGGGAGGIVRIKVRGQDSTRTVYEGRIDLKAGEGTTISGSGMAAGFGQVQATFEREYGQLGLAGGFMWGMQAT